MDFNVNNGIALAFSPMQALFAAAEGQHICGALGVGLSGENQGPLSRAAVQVPPRGASALLFGILVLHTC